MPVQTTLTVTSPINCTNSVKVSSINPNNFANINCLNLLALTSTTSSASSTTSLTFPIISPSNPTNQTNLNNAATSLTVYPLQVSSNGPTVLLAAATPTNPVVPSLSNLTSVINTPTLSSLFLTAKDKNPIITYPIQTSTPITKPKFKALWEFDSAYSSNNSNNNTTNTNTNINNISSINNTTSVVGQTTSNDSLNFSYDQTSQVQLTDDHNTTVVSGTNRSLKRHSPMSNPKPVVQTSKRLANLIDPISKKPVQISTHQKLNETDSLFESNRIDDLIELGHETNTAVISDINNTSTDISEQTFGKTYESGRRNLKEEAVSLDCV